MMCSPIMRPLAALLAAVILCACGHDPGTGAGAEAQLAAATPSAAIQPPSAAVARVVGKATPFTAVDLGVCLRIAEGQTPAAEDACPGFVSDSVAGAITTCKEAGGALVPAQQPSLQSLDVNGDGHPEFLFDFTANYGCDAAPSVFSCGSLGCPAALLEKQDGLWRTIGYLGSYDAIAAEVLAPEPGSTYGMLREGCGGDRPCEELQYHRWDGSAYQLSMMDVRGHWVDAANDGLWTLVKDLPILAEPSPGAAVVDRYPAGTEVVVLGNARGTPYKFVSPCNACKRGFIDPAGMRKTL